MPKVSVIVPIYGVEQYIQRCAESLFTQTLEDIEFIFVNDCTKDNSMIILEQCINKHPEISQKVKIINHSVNKGLPQARKTGFTFATGDYIIYCDSDDWVCADIYEKLYEKAISENADIAICSYYISDGKSNRLNRVSETSGLLMGPVWNKLVSRYLYDKGVAFPTANKAEDGVIMAQLSFYSKKKTYLDEPLYFYYYNPSSICRQLDEFSCISRMKQECENVDIRIDFLQRQNKTKQYYNDILIWKFEAINNLIPCISNPDIYKMWRDIYPEIGTEIIFSGNIRMIVKYLLLRFRLHQLIKHLS